METFLLTIIAVLLLAILVVAQVVRLIFRVSHPPYMMGGHTNAPLPSRTRSSGAGFVIVVIILALAWLQMGGKDLLPAQVNTPPATDEPYQAPHELEDPNVFFKEVSNKHTDEADETASWEVDRYNQHPDDALPTSFYAIQVSALSDEQQAKKMAQKLALQYQKVLIVYIDEQTPFKITIGPFESKEAAKAYKRAKGISGFVRLIERL